MTRFARRVGPLALVVVFGAACREPETAGARPAFAKDEAPAENTDAAPPSGAAAPAPSEATGDAAPTPPPAPEVGVDPELQKLCEKLWKEMGKMTERFEGDPVELMGNCRETLSRARVKLGDEKFAEGAKCILAADSYQAVDACGREMDLRSVSQEMKAEAEAAQ